MVTDTLHQFRPFYDMHRGFHAFDFIRGQERDLFRPPSPASEKKMENTLIGGPSAAHSEEIMHQYYANTVGRQRRRTGSPRRCSPRRPSTWRWRRRASLSSCSSTTTTRTSRGTRRRSTSTSTATATTVPSQLPSSGPSDWLTERQLERMHARYSAEVTMTDHWLGHFLDKAQDLGILDNTLLLVQSDHGHAFGGARLRRQGRRCALPRAHRHHLLYQAPGRQGRGPDE